MDGNHVSFFGNIFRQIIPLSIRHTPMTGTISSLQPPRVYTSGVSGPQSQAASSRVARAEEAVLGASFNVQSQTPDIPGASSRAAFSKYTVSLQAHSKAPDIHPLRTYGRAFGFLQRPSQSPGHSFDVVARVYGRALGFF